MNKLSYVNKALSLEYPRENFNALEIINPCDGSKIIKVYGNNSESQFLAELVINIPKLYDDLVAAIFCIELMKAKKDSDAFKINKKIEQIKNGLVKFQKLLDISEEEE